MENRRAKRKERRPRLRIDGLELSAHLREARTESLAEAGIPQIYLNIYQHPAKFLAFYLRGQVDPAAIRSINSQTREQQGCGGKRRHRSINDLQL
jgi:hypothetical protein